MNSKITEEIALNEICACSNVRMIDRLLSQYYDQCLAPSNIKNTQYSLLKNIFRFGNCSITKLGKLLLMDKSTLTRNIAVLEKMGFVKVEKQENDNRQKMLCITEEGIEKLKEATPYWRQAQNKIKVVLGEQEFDSFLEILSHLKEKEL